MKLDYIVSKRTNGANPFAIFESLSTINQDLLKRRIVEMKYSDFLQTAYWFAVSHTAKARAKMRCQVCNQPNGIQTHHRTYDSHGEEHLNMVDLVVLCESCHGLFHGHMPAVVHTPLRPIPSSRPEPRPALPIFKESDLIVPEQDPIVLTIELIEMCRTARRGFTAYTLDALGIGTEDRIIRGWIRRSVGRSVSRAQYRDAQIGRFVFGRHRRAMAVANQTTTG